MAVKRPEILFIFPHIDRTFCYHLGASYIIAYLKQRGIYSKLFICNESIGLNELIERILAEQPKILGFTCYDSNYYFVKLISQRLKIKNQYLMIIAGGPTATFSDKVIMKDIPEIDLCVRGEGEETVYELIQNCYKPSNYRFSNIQGVTYRENGRIAQNIDRPLIRDSNNKNAELDIIPSPYVSGVFDPIDQLQKNGELSILTSRGCVYRCTYCNFTAMSRYTIRYHSVDRVISELKIINNLRKQNTPFKASIHDDIFTLDPERVKQICQRMIEENINLDLWINTRADSVNKELLELLFKAGIRRINFGLESAVPRVLYNIKKVRFDYTKKNNFQPEKDFLKKVKCNIKIAKDIGFKISVSIMLGLPGETFNDGLKTIDFVKKLGVDEYCHNKLKIYTGTELYQNYKKYNIKFSKLKPGQAVYNPFFSPLIYSYKVDRIPMLKNKRLIKEELENMRYYLVDALMGTYISNRTKKKQCYSKDIILTNNDFNFEWLKENISLQTRFIYGGDIDTFLLKGDSKNKLLNLSIFGFYPEFQYYDAYESEKRLRENIDELRAKFLCMQLSQMDSARQKHQDKINIIARIATQEDLEALKKRVSFLKGNKNCGVNADTEPNYFLLDACRWSHACPAIQLPRLLIYNNSILPCFHGKAIGRVGDKIGQMQENMAGFIEKEKKRRGCDSCPARNNCAKCPFIGAFDIDQYCKIKREYTYVNTFINLLRITQKVRSHHEFCLCHRNS